MSYVKKVKKLGKDICPEGSLIRGRTARTAIKSIRENDCGGSGGGEVNPIQYLIDNNYNGPSCDKLLSNWGGRDLTNVLKNVDTSKVKNFTRMFNYCMDLKIIPLFDTSSGTNFYGMFEGCVNSNFDKDTLPLFNLSNAIDVSYMFSGCRQLKSIPLYDTQNVTTMDSTFNNCERLTEIPLLNTSKVTSMQSMFSNCSSLTTIPQFDMSKVSLMSMMFSRCTSLKSILMYGMRCDFNISSSTQFETEDLVTILSNCCSVVNASYTLTIGSTNLTKLDGVYVKETGIERYEGLTLRPCVICESTDEGAMLAIDYFNGKGWTLA